MPTQPTLPISVNWDSSGLPTPFIDYSGSVVGSVAITPGIRGRTYAAQRDTRPFPRLNVQWALSAAQMDAFETFWEGSLDNGAAMFWMDLLYPKTSTITEWVVQFVTDLEWGMSGSGRYTVSATIQLITSEITLDARADRITEDAVFNFSDDFESYSNTNGTQDVTPFPIALNGGANWDNTSWTVELS